MALNRKILKIILSRTPENDISVLTDLIPIILAPEKILTSDASTIFKCWVMSWGILLFHWTPGLYITSPDHKKLKPIFTGVAIIGMVGLLKCWNEFKVEKQNIISQAKKRDLANLLVSGVHSRHQTRSFQLSGHQTIKGLNGSY